MLGDPDLGMLTPECFPWTPKVFKKWLQLSDTIPHPYMFHDFGLAWKQDRYSNLEGKFAFNLLSRGCFLKDLCHSMTCRKTICSKRKTKILWKLGSELCFTTQHQTEIQHWVIHGGRDWIRAATGSPAADETLSCSESLGLFIAGFACFVEEVQLFSWGKICYWAFWLLLRQEWRFLSVTTSKDLEVQYLQLV